MSKLVKITPEIIAEATKEFEEALKTMKVTDGKISYSKSLGVSDKKAKVRFKASAYYKMMLLVYSCDKEIGWHGIATRGEQPGEYIVSDILVYPQEVTAATINPDQKEYEQWLMGLDDDQFNNLRFQGHSHVNMGVSPSGVDLNLYESLLGQLDDTMFYIFLIVNKRRDKFIKIYDIATNTLYETGDVEIVIDDDESGLQAFMSDASSKVREYKYTAPTPAKAPQSIATTGTAPVTDVEPKVETPEPAKKAEFVPGAQKPAPAKGFGTYGKNNFPKTEGKKTQGRTWNDYYYEDYYDDYGEDAYYGYYGKGWRNR